MITRESLDAVTANPAKGNQAFSADKVHELAYAAGFGAVAESAILVFEPGG